jgi:hypothetical protein
VAPPRPRSRASPRGWDAGGTAAGRDGLSGYPVGNGACRTLRCAAGVCGSAVCGRVQVLWLLPRRPVTSPYGKEGVAGSSPAEGFPNRTIGRFSPFRSGSVTTSGAREGVAGSSPTGDCRNRPLFAAFRSSALRPIVVSRSAGYPVGTRMHERGERCDATAALSRPSRTRAPPRPSPNGVRYTRPFLRFCEATSRRTPPVTRRAATSRTASSQRQKSRPSIE